MPINPMNSSDVEPHSQLILTHSRSAALELENRRQYPATAIQWPESSDIADKRCRRRRRSRRCKQCNYHNYHTSSCGQLQAAMFNTAR